MLQRRLMVRTIETEIEGRIDLAEYTVCAGVGAQQEYAEFSTFLAGSPGRIKFNSMRERLNKAIDVFLAQGNELLW